VEEVLAVIKERSWVANGTVLVTVDSKSKSKPSITAAPNGRGADEPGFFGPKIAQMLLAADMAAEAEGKPPSV
jgi:hypothetical protein